MQARFNSRLKLIAALLAPALLASSAAHGLQFVRCGSTVRISCCCPKAAPAAPSSALAQSTPQGCDKLAVPTVPAQNVGGSVPIVLAPMLVAVLGPSAIVEPIIERIRQIPRLDPPPGPSLVLANCARLI